MPMQFSMLRLKGEGDTDCNCDNNRCLWWVRLRIWPLGVRRRFCQYPTVNYDKYVEGTLFVTLVDKATARKVHLAGNRHKNSGGKSQSLKKGKQNIDYAVTQIFTNYPPGAKK
jgi:hypothetical protein